MNKVNASWRLFGALSLSTCLLEACSKSDPAPPPSRKLPQLRPLPRLRHVAAHADFVVDRVALVTSVQDVERLRPRRHPAALIGQAQRSSGRLRPKGPQIVL